MDEEFKADTKWELLTWAPASIRFLRNEQGETIALRWIKGKVSIDLELGTVLV